VIPARLIWPPYPYRAGFCITDDTDNADKARVKAVYDFLLDRGFVTTKTVWPFKPMERCGIPPVPDSVLRGVTCEDEEYRDYCGMLSRNGFEICLHGASAGNNLREATERAFQFLDEHFGPSDTFICHSKNAENIYWEHKVTDRFPFSALLRLYSSHSCEGEVESSPFFWGDVCARRINQVRLFRTRRTNTLARNPSMPYYDPRKPYVNGWFSATKRSLADCASPDALDRLKKENGLTVLYQYLDRYANDETLAIDERFARGVENILGDGSILVDTVSGMMRRLRACHGLFVVSGDDAFWIVNTGDEPVRDLQVALGAGVSTMPSRTIPGDGETRLEGNTLVISSVPAQSVTKYTTGVALAFSGERCKRLNKSRRLAWKLPLGTVYVNLSDIPWEAGNDIQVKPGSFQTNLPRSGTGTLLHTTLPAAEEWKLLSDQVSIILREILLKGRSLDAEKYLGGPTRTKHEDQYNW